MLFSSNIFLFAFLPVVLAVYYGLLKDRGRRNRFLLLASVVFYAWGSVPHVLILLGSIVANWFFANWIVKKVETKSRRWALAAAISFNVLILFIFKYLSFTIANVNTLFNCELNVPKIALPLGISFFTFQAMSYVIDVYKGKGKALRNPLDVGLYISLFPQLVAGPIVRFEDFNDQIQNREESFDSIREGLFRFGYGLGKKVLIANSLGVVAETAFAQSGPSLMMAWLGAISFTLQIYFDFSGYSDMAIGLGKMFGFQFKENFNYPYISASVSEFWRRWHISMGSWFRDYIYIPLGGSRVARPRVFLNLFIVWAITGLWHGANWTFVAWGMLQFLAIAVEKLFKVKEVKGFFRRGLGITYTLLFVILGWVFFNSPTIGDGARYISSMFNSTVLSDSLALTMLSENWLVIALGLMLSTPIYANLKKRLASSHQWVECCVVTCVYLLSFIFVVKGSYSPFIYFNF